MLTFDLKGSFNKSELFGKGKFRGMHTYDDAFLYVSGGRNDRGDVEIVDVLPTILAMMGVHTPAVLDGSPVAWSSRWGWVRNVVLALKRWEGR